ncbi:hypothetical protein FNJ47_05285 [Bradyrhizobium sp. UFLA 03-164]|uniref:DUF680 domain-containing protein n=1 Tax=Bradyrhizobium uaiense TaxID=2594946 RepID=A0A6P1BA76_9BRAD|nr:hypothetical protein [Bradyrhizobium uaiense]
MTKLTLVCAGVLVITAIAAAPAIAREKHASVRKVQDAYGSLTTPASTTTKTRPCLREPDVGSFATAPYRRPPCVPTTGY